MSDRDDRPIARVLDVIGKIVAIALVAVWIVLLINAQWDFLSGIPQLYNILNIARQYGGLLLIAIVGLEGMANRHIVLRIIFLVCLAIIVIFLFFPGTYDNLIGFIRH